MLVGLGERDFDKVYDILADSFPTDEIRPYRQQRALLANEAYKILGLYDDQNDAVKAFITVYELDSIRFVEHFAVNPLYRNRGLGTMILRELLDGGGKMVCLEVEPPTTELAGRRIEFYRRNGFYLNDYHYIQPPLAENQGSIELSIMSSGKPLSPDEFETVKAEIYEKAYRYTER